MAFATEVRRPAKAAARPTASHAVETATATDPRKACAPARRIAAMTRGAATAAVRTPTSQTEWLRALAIAHSRAEMACASPTREKAVRPVIWTAHALRAPNAGRIPTAPFASSVAPSTVLPAPTRASVGAATASGASAAAFLAGRVRSATRPIRSRAAWRWRPTTHVPGRTCASTEFVSAATERRTGARSASTAAGRATRASSSSAAHATRSRRRGTP